MMHDAPLLAALQVQAVYAAVTFIVLALYIPWTTPLALD